MNCFEDCFQIDLAHWCVFQTYFSLTANNILLLFLCWRIHAHSTCNSHDHYLMNLMKQDHLIFPRFLSMSSNFLSCNWELIVIAARIGFFCEIDRCISIKLILIIDSIIWVKINKIFNGLCLAENLLVW
jgi:hypothetical protein